MVINILIALVAIIVVFCIIVALQPADFTVTRSATASAPAETVFTHVNDLHKWESWSPWAKLDPKMKTTYDGPAAGAGAAYAWAGNMQVGAGRMTIVESRPGELVRLNLDFLKPMEAHNVVEFTFKTAGPQTKITWVMTGKKNFKAKAFGLFVNFDKMCGGMFEKGLAGLTSVAEATAAETAR